MVSPDRLDDVAVDADEEEASGGRGLPGSAVLANMLIYQSVTRSLDHAESILKLVRKP